MRLGISSYTYTWAIGVPGYARAQPMSPQGLVEKAAELDVRVVQIADNMPLDQLDDEGIESLADLAERHNIQIEVGTRGIAPQHLRTYLQLAQRFASPLLRVVVDTATHQPSADEIVAMLGKVMPEFERADITLAIENHDRFPVATLVDILRRLDSPKLGICLDTVNSFGALEGPAVVVEALGAWTVNLHIKDFIVRRADHAMGFSIDGCAAGSGQLNVPWLLDQLNASSSDYSAILELWTPPLPSLEETVQREEEWTQTSIAYLRRLISG